MSKKYNFLSVIITILCVLAFVVIYLYRTTCQNEFGPEFNSKRRALQIPIIGRNWRIKQRDFNMTWWMGKELVIGHEGKRIVYNGCEIDEEIDDYFFSLKQLQDTAIQIRYKYINSTRKKDSISFSYQIGSYARFITKQQADSIFKVNNINKDY